MKVLIHACKKREWYVNEFIKPSLLNSGFNSNDILIFMDENMEGVRKSYLKSFEMLPNDNENTWHLQDDVLPCTSFYERAIEYEQIHGVINGFGNINFYKNNPNLIGEVYCSKNMFYSFPAIRIPNDICHKFKKWVIDNEENESLKKYYDEGKYIDYFFKLFIDDIKPMPHIFNITPCMVDHVDHYLGGSTINKRDKYARALLFTDKEAMKNLINYIERRTR